MQNRHASPRIRSLLLGAVALLLVVGAAFAGFRYWQAANEKKVPMAALETLGPIPAWLAAADTKVIEDYAWALNHHEELQYIPCYCGCDTLGHKNNSTCYFKRDGAGKVTGYEDHAMT